MKQLFEKCKFLSLVGVASLLLAAALTFVLGAVKTIQVGVAIVMSFGRDPLIFVSLLQIMDVFLIGTVLLVFAVSLHELFIGKLDLPTWMVAHNLYELKVKLGSVLILFMAGTFVERLVEGKNPQDLMFLAIAIAVVSAALIALGSFSNSE